MIADPPHDVVRNAGDKGKHALGRSFGKSPADKINKKVKKAILSPSGPPLNYSFNEAEGRTMILRLPADKVNIPGEVLASMKNKGPVAKKRTAKRKRSVNGV